MPFYHPTGSEEKVITQILSFLNPRSFLQAAILWNFMLVKGDPVREQTESVAQSLDEIKNADANIFCHADTCLTAKIERISGGLTNACFKLKTSQGAFFLRIPGKGSEEHLSREDESYNVKVIEPLGFNIQFHFINARTGLYVSEFIQDPTPLTSHQLHSPETLREVAGILKTLHGHPTLFRNTLDCFKRLEKLLEKLENYRTHQYQYPLPKTITCVLKLQTICMQDTTPYVPCHNDPNHLNFLYQGRRLKLLDWEYSGNNKALYDLANFAMTSNLSRTQETILLEAYFGASPSPTQWQCFDAYKQVTNLWYYLWAELQIANQSNVVPLEELHALAELHWNMAMASESRPSSPTPMFYTL